LNRSAKAKGLATQYDNNELCGALKPLKKRVKSKNQKSRKKSNYQIIEL